jgi:hypothetical protein
MFVDVLIVEDFLDVEVIVLFEDVKSHVVVVIIDWFLDLVVDYNLIFFLPDMEKDAAFISAFGLAHEVFAVLDCSEENA